MGGEREREKEREGLWWDGRYGVKLENQNEKTHYFS